MNKFLTALLTMFITMQSANAMSIDAVLDKYLTPVSDFVSGIVFTPVSISGTQIPIVILWVLIGGLFFSFYLRGIAFWGLKHSIQILQKPGRHSKQHSQHKAGFIRRLNIFHHTLGKIHNHRVIL